ncbi:cis-3-chloroacrylic acid dehalogenase, putative [Glarea lozoyensis ATCC 20868]|uniref:Cis-3-chloroacrylic acid dehalogenase, putative n=1 Tax=Glarea lozoyensis (strain ATCC 20868 / MF5171) TaxID=1116229 RepID=S3D0W4_GLAL2|nr:cis-3-chloroacrylic acid dehalogenase, putative [Glarea lozoyensis ATCC 20868]EPE25671.1 cis-3-chloroacrylic acid dehalogenase, putative [Glarea lozoyensis ATCC 20868]
MPFYHIQHSASLAPSQRQNLATSLTNLHAQTFNTPSLFVNIKFTAHADSNAEDFFVGGNRKDGTNVIFAYVRGGGGRGQEGFDKLAKEMEACWDEVVGNQEKLQGIFIVPGLVARERGLAIPVVGKEAQWLEENWSDFEKMAAAGDEDFKGLVDEVKKRPELLQSF